ncbi:hypothetical protein J2S43_004619 [Catenuloplanes nepalensis]|uniref:CBM6 domain-containing protein n=1 Tax=Catenuloplanes nepalensis TaxID=587533 RepID=A0ABT9MXD5_9ACTN|nr:hypothetical protein [Catenuloplanes nepalensis]MDP9796107.1 hypothetical protein [Catenuloplanes nepalensis]
MSAAAPERGWWAIGALAAGVLATTLAVPSLVSDPNLDLGTPVAAPSSAPAPTTASPAPSPSPSGEDGFGQSPTPSPSPSTSSPAPPPPPSAPPPAFTTIRIAAADPANERFRVEATDCPTCASGSRIQYLGQGQALTVHVRGVTVGGRRDLTIYYTCGGGARPLDIIVNNGDKVSLELAGNDSWIDPATVTIPIDLPVGDTEIRLFHATDASVDLDQFVIE